MIVHSPIQVTVDAETVFTWAVCAGLAAWLVLTVIKTSDMWFDWDISSKFGILNVVTPNWNFFAPHPGRWDYHLLYREKRADGSVGHWTEADEILETPQRFKWVWNAELFTAKALFDICQELTKLVAGTPDSPRPEEDEETSEGVEGMQPVESHDHIISTSYILMLNYISNKELSEDAEKVQFMLMRSSLRESEPTPMFISNFHRL